MIEQFSNGVALGVGFALGSAAVALVGRIASALWRGLLVETGNGGAP